MKIFLEKAIFFNRAPFEHLELNLNENDIALISAFNGKGKTTLLSHITDAFYEIARPHFSDFIDKRDAFYRISSLNYNLDRSKPSIVYLRFKTSIDYIDYVDIRGNCTQDQYNSTITLNDKINFSEIEKPLEADNFIKYISKNLNKKKAENIFQKNLLTYFPSYRYETPGYLTDPYKIKLHFKKESIYTGYLQNSIEVVSKLSEITNWIMDIILDLRTKVGDGSGIMFQNLNQIITMTLISKGYGSLRFGIGNRDSGINRIQILENNKSNEKCVYPNLFNISSGESAILCIFGEILRQADNNRNNIPVSEITGIVLIDEIDKHLHIKLQKETLPALLKSFPNLQFILSSHSPFLSMGLAEQVYERSKIIDIGTGAIIAPTSTPQYQEVYEIMVSENNRYKILYDKISSQIETSKELQIITEGKNTEHIIKAISLLNPNLLSKIKVITGVEHKTGETQLKTTFEIMVNAKNTGKFLFIWDCDSFSIVNSITESQYFYKFCFTKNSSNTVAKKGIENLYQAEIFSDDLYEKRESECDYGGYKSEKIFNKVKFLEKIKLFNDITHFTNFKPLIEKIESIIQP